MKSSQSGNVIFYVLVAVALLAALSYAVTNSSRGNAQQLSAEKARMYATEILEYASTMASGVNQLRLRGVPATSLCFDHAGWGASNYNHAGCTDNANKIYHSDGAGLIWGQPPSEAMDATATPDNLWHIYGDNEVKNIGTTTGAAASSELLLVVDELSLSVCQQINGLLGVTETTSAPPTDTAFGETRFIGSFGYSNTIGDEDAVLEGKQAACFQKTDTPTEYVFYKVLLSR